MTDQNDEISPEAAEDRFIAFISASLRKPERLDDETFEPRLMAAVRTAAAAAGTRQMAKPRWWQRTRTVQITPVRALIMAAGLVGIAVLSGTVGRALSRRSSAITVAADGRLASSTDRNSHPDTVYMVRFVLVAPSAKNVALIGDFNNWNRGATQLAPTGAKGLWTATVPLASGRYEYAFIVDGKQWLADPTAPVMVQDDFGTTSSLVTVGMQVG